MPQVLLLVGLGNPGAKYARHRHNVGYMAVDAIAEAHGFGAARAKFQGEIREGFLEGPGGRQKAIALKPLTYMNESGRAVGEAMRFFKLEPNEIVIIHDELDLAAGKIKAKLGGGTAGHNGLRSIDGHIGPNFRRVRIGIGHPGDKARVSGHVLGDFAKSDKEWLDPLLKTIAEAAPMLADSDARFTSEVALRLAPKKERPAKDAAPAGDSDAPAAPAPAPSARRHGPLADTLRRLLGRKD